MKKFISFSKLTFLVALVALLASCQKQQESITEISKEKLANTTLDAEGYVSNAPFEVKTGKLEGRDITYIKQNGLNIYEGDIIVTDEQLQELDYRGTITTVSSKIWPNKTLVWAFASGLDQATKDKWNAAKNHWAANTNVKFKQRTTETDYVRVIKNEDGCYSYIGRIGGVQDLSIASGCTTGNTIHEIGHAIGLFHEHSRTDRDNYVKVISANIKPGAVFNFNKCSSCAANGTLDFGSIMMYSSYAFSVNGLPTITKLNGSTFSVQRNALSTKDKRIVATKY